MSWQHAIQLLQRRAPITAPNRWGWGPGHQNSAEFEILADYLAAAWQLPRKLIREISIDRRSRKEGEFWRIEYSNGMTREVPL